MSDFQKLLEVIEMRLENFLNPVVNLSLNTNLGNYFNSLRDIEYQIDLLKGIIEERLKNSSPLLSFIDKNVNTELLKYAKLPFRIPRIQQRPELPHLDEEILDFSDESRWSHSICLAWKDWFSKGQVYDSINNEFNNKCKIFKKNLTEFLKLLQDHIKQYGSIGASINKTEIQTNLCDYSFVNDSTLKGILKRDYVEIQKCLANECWKATMVLCGSSIEALFHDCLSHFEKEIESYIPSGKKIDELKLEQLINIARQCGFITIGVERFGHSLRDYRNLVHPIKELNGDYKIEGPEARACVEVLHMVIRDIQKKHRANGKI